MFVADRNSRDFVTRSQIIFDAVARLSTSKLRLARSDFSRSFVTHKSQGGASRLCRYGPSLSNRSNRWGQPWPQQAYRRNGPAQMLPTDRDPEVKS